ncbi:MAG: S-adenosylmethionine decarboxylase [Thermodesulfobacteriota bacterium]
MEGFGRHFTFDGVIKDISLIEPERVRDFLNKCPDEIEMTKITLPSVYEIGGKVIGMVIIAESHISFHGNLNTGLINIDVFSCMFFSFKTAFDTAEKYFPCNRVKTNFIERGLEFVRT